METATTAPMAMALPRPPARRAPPPPQPRRMFHTLRRMELTGSTLGPLREHALDRQWQRTGARTKLQTVADLPTPFLEQLNAEEGRAYERAVTFNGLKRSLAHLIREVYDLVDSEPPVATTATATSASSPDKKQLRRLMHEIVQRVLEPNVLHGALGGAHGGTPDAVAAFIASEREKFLRLGGPECLLRVIHAMRLEEQVRPPMAMGFAMSDIREGHVCHRRNVHDRHDVRSLWDSPAVARSPAGGTKNQHDTGVRKAILNDAMGILRELCYFSLALARQLCSKDGLIVYLFELMEENKFFDNAAGLVEEILAVREDSFDLSRIPRFHEIVASFSSRQLAFFCRVLALVVFEPEDRRLLETSKVIKSMELLKLRRSRMLRADNIVDRNHAMIFNAERILSRLLTVLQVQNYYFAVNPVYEPFSNELATSAEFAVLLSQTSDRSDWESIARLTSHQHLASGGEFTVLRQNHSHALASSHSSSMATRSDSNTSMSNASINSLPLSVSTGIHDEPPDLAREADNGHDHQHSHPALSIETAILRDLIFRNRTLNHRSHEDVEAQVIMKSIVLAPYRVEVLFVLCTLLNGKRKIDFQDRLASMGLVTTLNAMFDKFQWQSTTPPSSQAPLHGPGCGCSLDASLKIQFLRLIHNFCDRDYNDNTSKLLLLSPSELELLNGSDMRPIDLMHPDKGLLCKIINTLIEQPADSIYRFWLSSCVEAFLRRAAPNEQLFVARTPLLQSLVNEILSGGGYRAQGSFQSAFDLLGEMTKGNWQTLQLFHRKLDNTQFASFMEVVIRNLVDSNVFVRSMLLSAEKFAKAPRVGTFGLADDSEMDRMSAFLSVNIVRLLKDLMTIVSLDDVNHENICCLNTAVVMLIFQHRRQQLPGILSALRSHEDLSGKTGYVCANFRALLWFWIQYYTPRGRDRLSLEHSSDVKFEEWRHVVALLCADDGSDTALLPEPMRLPASPYSRLYASMREARQG